MYMFPMKQHCCGLNACVWLPNYVTVLGFKHFSGIALIFKTSNFMILLVRTLSV